MGGSIDFEQKGWVSVICEDDRDLLVTKVRCKNRPDSERGDFRYQRAFDSSSSYLLWPIFNWNTTYYMMSACVCVCAIPCGRILYVVLRSRNCKYSVGIGSLWMIDWLQIYYFVWWFGIYYMFLSISCAHLWTYPTPIRCLYNDECQMQYSVGCNYSSITSTPYVVLPLFASRFAACTGGI